MAIDLSTDAGLYLCEFTYFTSLHYGYCPALFLHVPPFDDPYSPDDLNKYVKVVIQVLLGKRLSKHADGNETGQFTYAAPGGHLEFAESFVDCAVREMKEECGVVLRNVSVGPALNVVQKSSNYHSVVICCVGEIDQEPSNCEPEKCAGWEWHIWANDLPEPTFPSLVEAKAQGFDPFVV
eukprot:TRINITY_DN11659_c0_g1_i2.p2 TRINITY_DN11659_c0_g1~~TRINITY_DN11659_c0_g1_i2.p2  ORF type:complete len:180 (+),score=16.67 TRINITY_DN11659_c0_g1_i2:321-860(+)